MRQYAINVGELQIVSDTPISDEMRAAVLKALQEDFRDRVEDLGGGLALKFAVRER